MKDALIGKKGQGVLEILIAMGILVATLAAAILVIFGGQSLLLDTNESQRALNLAREDLENVWRDAQRDFNGLANASSTQGEFLKEIIIEDIATSTKRVTSRVSWSTDSLRVQKVELVTIITDWRREQETGGDSGGGPPFGDWKNPITFGTIDLGPGNQSTDIDVLNNIIYLAAEASAINKPDFFIIDATSGQNPVITASLNVGKSLKSLDVASGYAFAGTQNASGSQMLVLNISNIASPSIAATYSLPGTSGSGAYGNTVFYAGNRVYLGTKTATGPEFHVIDVSTPTSPSNLGTMEIGADVNMIYVTGETAYLATSDTGQELKIFDVSNPASIVQIGSWNAPGSGVGSAVDMTGGNIYLGRESLASNHEFFILNVANPASPVNLGSAEIGTSITDMRARGDLAFLGTSESNSEFQVWNTSSTSAITFWSSFNFPQVVTGIDYENNLVYVAVRSNDALRIITSQ